MAWLSMLKVQVQVPEAQTRFIFSMVHWGAAVTIMLTAAVWRTSSSGAGAAKAVAERTAARMVAENFILMIDVLFWVESATNVLFG